jgi:beta-alanine--pyruvate transaminase
LPNRAQELDFAPPLQHGPPEGVRARREAGRADAAGLNKVFYTNSGSESVETALKMAIAYHRVRGEGSRTRLIGRERGYHGVNFGGISVGGIVANRKMFGTLLTGVDHIRHTHDLARNAFSRGVPEHGAELADDLERPGRAARCVDDRRGDRRAGGRLYRRCCCRPKAICGAARHLRQARHPADLRRGDHRFGRLGSPFAGNSLRRHTRPDDGSQGITNGCVPMGAVFAKQHIHDVS